MHGLKPYFDRLRRILKETRKETEFFVAVCFLITIMAIFVYTVAHSVIRNAANDPQNAMAMDAAFLLSHNAPMGPIVPEIGVELSRSQETFIQVYDEKGSLLDSNATLNGKSLKISKKALSYAKKHGESYTTWQPEKGVRIAAVIVAFQGQNPGFVVTGRSLYTAESRIADAAKLCLLFWTIMMLSAYSFYRFRVRK
ncbi:MAG: hypothetical protein WCT49_05445 [Candidatus Paceibacterota bacterium]